MKQTIYLIAVCLMFPAFALAAGAGEPDAAGLQAIQGGSLTAFEKACDNALNAYMQKAKYIPFGEQPMLGYVSAKDNEFTAIRIILTGRLADLPADVIRERLRNAYV